MSTKAPRITDLDEDFAGDPLRHLARYCLPDHLVNLQGLAFVAGYNVDISSRLLDDGGLTYQTVVHRVTADGELHGSEYIIGMAEYHGAGWTMIPQGTGTLPDAAVGVEVAVRRTPITTLIRRIGSNINDWDFADSGDPQQDRRIRAEHDARHAGGTVDQIIEAAANAPLPGDCLPESPGWWSEEVIATGPDTVVYSLAGSGSIQRISLQVWASHLLARSSVILAPRPGLPSGEVRRDDPRLWNVDAERWEDAPPAPAPEPEPPAYEWRREDDQDMLFRADGAVLAAVSSPYDRFDVYLFAELPIGAPFVRLWTTSDAAKAEAVRVLKAAGYIS